jgi:hypothetical protein
MAVLSPESQLMRTTIGMPERRAPMVTQALDGRRLEAN